MTLSGGYLSARCQFVLQPRVRAQHGGPEPSVKCCCWDAEGRLAMMNVNVRDGLGLEQKSAMNRLQSKVAGDETVSLCSKCRAVRA
jgi:hypothetical protein